MVTQNMLRTHEGKYIFSDKKLLTALELIKRLIHGQKAEIAPYGRTYF